MMSITITITWSKKSKYQLQLLKLANDYNLITITTTLQCTCMKGNHAYSVHVQYVIDCHLQAASGMCNGMHYYKLHPFNTCMFIFLECNTDSQNRRAVACLHVYGK